MVPKEKLIERSKLAEYEIRRAPDPYRHMPTDEEIQKLVRGIHDHWNPATNPAARYRPQMKRLFHRDKDYAIILGLLDSACRIGEMLSLKVTDYSPSERGITIRQSKGRTSRTLPVSDDWAEALSVWLKLRSRVMEAVPPEEDEGWIFISETGRRLSERNFLRSLKGYLAYAGVTERVCLHSLRRYSLNKLARTNLLAARDFAGHQDAKTTLIYTS